MGFLCLDVLYVIFDFLSLALLLDRVPRHLVDMYVLSRGRTRLRYKKCDSVKRNIDRAWYMALQDQHADKYPTTAQIEYARDFIGGMTLFSKNWSVPLEQFLENVPLNLPYTFHQNGIKRLRQTEMYTLPKNKLNFELEVYTLAVGIESYILHLMAMFPDTFYIAGGYAMNRNQTNDIDMYCVRKISQKELETLVFHLLPIKNAYKTTIEYKYGMVSCGKLTILFSGAITKQEMSFEERIKDEISHFDIRQCSCAIFAREGLFYRMSPIVTDWYTIHYKDIARTNADRLSKMFKKGFKLPYNMESVTCMHMAPIRRPTVEPHIDHIWSGPSRNYINSPANPRLLTFRNE